MNFLAAVCSFLCLLGFYLQINVGFPYSLYISSGIFLFLVLPIRRIEIWVILGTVAMLLPTFCLIVPTQPFDYLLWDYVPSSGQLGLTMIATLGLYKGLLRIKPPRFAQIFYVLLLAILLGTILEVAGPLRPMSDAVRTSIYPPEFTYESFDRDISEYGFYRPKFFTAEPSHLGKVVSLMFCLAAVASPSVRRNIFLLLLSVTAAALIRSPACLIGIVAVTANLGNLVGWKRLLTNPIILLASMFLFSVVGWRVTIEANRRLGFGGAEVESSAYVRLIGPLLVTGEALRQKPVFGFGLGADNALHEVWEVFLYSEMSTDYVQDNPDMYHAVFGNAYSAFLIQFGVVGTIFALAGIYWIKMYFGRGKSEVFWIFLMILGLFDPPINTPYFWGQIFLMLVAVEVGRRNIRVARILKRRRAYSRSFRCREINPRVGLETLAS